MAEQDKVQLQKNIRLAQQLGASVETSHGDEVPAQIIEFARLSGVSQIVIGRSTVGKKRFFDKPTLRIQAQVIVTRRKKEGLSLI